MVIAYKEFFNHVLFSLGMEKVTEICCCGKIEKMGYLKRFITICS